MPLINTIGTAAARSYGFGLKTGIGGKIIFYSSSAGSITTANNSTNVIIDSSKNSEFSGTLGSNWLIFKATSSGTVSWQKTITGTYASTGRGAYVDSSNKVYLVGSDGMVGAGGYGYANLNVFDSSGTSLLYVGILNINGGAGAQSINYSAVRTDSSGNIYCAGSYSFTSGAYQYGLLVKYNSSGTIQWTACHGVAVSGLSTQFYDMYIDSSTNIYCVGYQRPNIAGQPNKCYISKYLSTGDLYDLRILTDSVAQNYSYVSIDSDGSNLYVTGYTYNGTIYEIVVVKYTSTLAISWKNRIYTSTTVRPLKVVYDSINTCIYVIGWVVVSSINNLVVVKLNTSGSIVWQKMIGTSVGLIGTNISVDSSNMYITGQISTVSTQAIEFVFPVSNGISGTFTANGYTFTCSDSSLSSGTSSLTDSSVAVNGTTPTYSIQNSFGSINTITSITSNVTPI